MLGALTREFLLASETEKVLLSFVCTMSSSGQTQNLPATQVFPFTTNWAVS